AHEDAAPRLGQRSVHHQAGDDVSFPGHRFGAHLDAVLGVDADDHARAAVDLAVDPDLAVVVDVRLEPDPRPGYLDAVRPRRQLDGGAVPGKGKADGAAGADVRAHLPAGVIVVGGA